MPDCPMCGGAGMYLGPMGLYEWFRCRNCGMDFNVLADDDVLDAHEEVMLSETEVYHVPVIETGSNGDAPRLITEVHRDQEVQAVS